MHYERLLEVQVFAPIYQGNILLTMHLYSITSKIDKNCNLSQQVLFL